ncbi:MAG: hypothetical protein JWO93_2253 [Micrococcaceae bacterium]|jgi:hypothetical protein|nr:hypothetical protein [Micrococcaceae bacterium]
MSAEQWSVTEPGTLEMDGVRELDAAIVRGRLDIITHEEPTTVVEVTSLSGRPLEISLDGGVLRVGYGDFGVNWLTRIVGGGADRAVISIAVPAGTTVRAATVSGDGLVCGTSAGTVLKTVSGSLMADDTSGTLTAETVSGEIIARHHTGPLVTKSVSGEITASGYLSSVRASTVSGDLSFDILGAPDDLVSKSVSGDVTVRLPEGMGVEVKAKTTSGTVLVDDRKFSGTASNVSASSGPEGGALTMRSTSVSGNISVVHQQRAYSNGHQEQQ